MNCKYTINADSPSIKHLRKKDKRLNKLIDMVGPIAFNLHDDNPYSFLVHEIIEQMLSVKVGQKIFLKFAALCNDNVVPDIVSTLSIEDIKKTGMSYSKAKSIVSLTNAIASGSLNLCELFYLDDKEVITELTKVHGIGPWTAKMYLLFVLGRPDILPYEDGAFLQTYRWLYKTDDCSSKVVIKKCAKWKPYSSIASRYFYKALDMGLTKEEFHLFKE